MPTAMGRSKAELSLRMSAGARLTVTRRRGHSYPALRRAAMTRSLLSRTALSGRPTTVKEGSCRSVSTSTWTRYASIPRVAALSTTAGITSLQRGGELPEGVGERPTTAFLQARLAPSLRSAARPPHHADFPSPLLPGKNLRGHLPAADRLVWVHARVMPVNFREE